MLCWGCLAHLLVPSRWYSTLLVPLGRMDPVAGQPWKGWRKGRLLFQGEMMALQAGQVIWDKLGQCWANGTGGLVPWGEEDTAAQILGAVTQEGRAASWLRSRAQVPLCRHLDVPP